jgi:predicted PurR-regulated permease PerM
MGMSTQLTPENGSLLSGGQRRMMAFALTLLAASVSVILLVSIFMILGRLLGQFSGVLWPLAVAGVLALILRPAVDLLQRRLKLRRMPAVIVLYALFLVMLGGILVLLLPPLATQLLDLIAFLPEFAGNAAKYAQTHYPDWVSLVERMRANPTIATVLNNVENELNKLPSLILPSLKAVSDGVFSTISFATHFAVFPIYLFFFLLSRAAPTAKLAEQLTFLRPGVRNDIVFLVDQFIGIVVSFFRGQFIIALIMGVLLGLGFWLVGLKFGLILGLALGILNIVPYLGTIVGLAVTIPLSMLQPGGGIILLALVLAVYAAVQFIEGWFLTPKIMGDRTGLHPGVIIFAIFFWGTALNGIMGMIIAIPLTAFFVTFWRLMKHKYFEHPVLTEIAPTPDNTPESRDTPSAPAPGSPGSLGTPGSSGP